MIHNWIGNTYFTEKTVDIVGYTDQDACSADIIFGCDRRFDKMDSGCRKDDHRNADLQASDMASKIYYMIERKQLN